MRIGTIPELHLRIVRIPTLSADSGIVPDNSRIAQGVFYRLFCYNQALRKVGMGWWVNMHGSPIFNFDRLQRGVLLIFKLEYNPTAATSNTLHFVCTVACSALPGLSCV